MTAIAGHAGAIRTQPLLSGAHRAILEGGSGIAPDVIAERGYWTARTWLDLRAGGVLDLRGTQIRPECFPAMVIPQFSPLGEPLHALVRWDHPRVTRAGRAIKIDTPAGVGPRIDCPPRCVAGIRDVERPLWLTEGSKKADSLASHGEIAISTPGVTAWQSQTAVLDLVGIPLKKRPVIIAFDSDVMTKSAVRDAMLKLARWLEVRDALPYVIDWTKLNG